MLSLARWLIDKSKTDMYRRGTLSGWKHRQVDAGLIRDLGGMENLRRQAKELECDPVLGMTGRIYFDWGNLGDDIRIIHYNVDIIPELCQREGIEDLRQRQLRYIQKVAAYAEESQGSWLMAYYRRLDERLRQGKDVKEIEDEKLFWCLNEIVKIEKPVWKRIFSAKIFYDSKIFEQQYEKKVVGILRDYSPLCQEGMNEDEILAVHGILSYAQTLEWKGLLCYQLDNGIIIDTRDNIYGTIINAQTLEHAVPIAIPAVKRIMTIENKANYESMEYTKDTLYIFCHGFFSPKEIRFLRGLLQIADENTEYYHWGDMDYGGIRIFQFNKKHVFPALLPYHMGKADFERAVKKGGIVLDKGKRGKLEKMCAGELEELKQCILESGMEIEQEILLAKG